MYVRRIHWYPRVDSGTELRDSLTSMVKQSQAQGRRVSLMEQALPGDGPCYVTAEVFDDLAALDVQRQQLRAAATTPEARARAALLRSPIAVTLFEIIVPMTAA